MRGKGTDLFSPDLLGHFERFLSGIYDCERRNVETINDAFVVQVKNQSSSNRFWTEYKWSRQELNERREEVAARSSTDASAMESIVIGTWSSPLTLPWRATTAHGSFWKRVNDRLSTVGDVCRQVQGEALAALISFCLTQMAQGVNLESVLERALSHLAR
jgi:hypothetical protein